MCHETIRRAVVQKFNETKKWNLEKFDQLYNKIDDIKEANDIINGLKICDPAVGSGHFLVSALNEIIAIKSELGVLSDRDGKLLRDYSVFVANDELIVETGLNEFFEYKPGNKESQRIQEALFHEKQTLIENCLFGVDVNPNSVKICRLRLWIELLKNAYYTIESKYRDLETLPNIDINIKRGNSLISRFTLDSDLSKALKSIKYSIDDYKAFVNNYKNATDKEKKRGFEKLIEQIKKDFRTEIGKNDPKVLLMSKRSGELYNLLNQARVFELTEKEKKEQQKRKEKLETDINKLSTEIEEIKNSIIYNDAFEWRFEFPEILDDEGKFIGFDAVIGNPPYISLQRMKGEAKAFESQNYSTYTKLGDIYCLFYEKGTSLLKANGLLTFITSNSWLRTQYGKLLRDFFREKANPLLLLNIEDTQLFDEATVESNILTIENSRWSNLLMACSIKNDFSNQIPLESYFSKNAIRITDLPSDGWNIGNNGETEIRNKIDTGSTPLKEIDVTIYRGVTTGFNDAFYIDGKKRNELVSKSKRNGELIKPAIRGKDLSKYSFKHEDLYVIFSRRGIKINEYPEVEEHLMHFKKQLEPKPDNWNGTEWIGRKPGTYKWYEIQDNTAYYKEFEKEKLVWGELSDDSKFAYDDSGSYPNNTVFILTGKSLKYLLAILNSNLAKWYFNLIATSSGMGTNRWLKYKIEQLPIKDISESKQKPFEKVVDEILKARKKNANADTLALEKEIDQLVYQLYGLTEEEIRIVEGA
jgi:type II restriction/modification system DNA methylase subunit YeeA